MYLCNCWLIYYCPYYKPKNQSIGLFPPKFYICWSVVVIYIYIIYNMCNILLYMFQQYIIYTYMLIILYLYPYTRIWSIYLSIIYIYGIQQSWTPALRPSPRSNGKPLRWPSPLRHAQVRGWPRSWRRRRSSKPLLVDDYTEWGPPVIKPF